LNRTTTDGGESQAPRTFAEIYLPAKSAIAWEDVVQNVESCAARGIEIVREIRPPNPRKLSIVGGSPSVVDHLDEIRGTDVWAINRTHKWLAEKGINSLLFSVDPDECLADCVHGGAILSSAVHPSVWDKLEGKPSLAFHQMGGAPEGWQGLTIAGSSTTAGYGPALGLWLGYRDITFYGCEGSFPNPDEGGVTHAYTNEAKDVLQIDIGGGRYWCNVDHLYQCERLSDVINLNRTVFKERSGGMLRAFVEHGKNYRVTGMSDHLFKQFFPQAA
jgi:hypothetical protein